MGRKVSGSCRICGSIDANSFQTNGYAWSHCKTCGSVQKDLTHDQYLALNPTYDPGAYLDSASRGEIERFLRLDDSKKVLDRFIPRVLRPSDTARRSFLDIGCGMGAYLLAAQSFGFDVMGFEPSETHSRVAIKHLKLPVVSDYFSSDRVGDRRFDVVMLSHVIEHIYSPNDFLRDVIAVLKPGGALIVITPNANSIIARWTGKRWPMLKPVDHVSMLCARTYRYFELNDIAEVKHHYSEFPYEFAATLAAVSKSRILRESVNKQGHGAHPSAQGISAPPPLKALNVRAQALKAALTIASMPFWMLSMATRRRACLNSIIVKKNAVSASS